MGKKNKGGGGGDHQKDENGGGGGGGGSSNVVLKMDLHCSGCISKISSIISSYDGVDDVTFDRDAGKVTVIGSLDPAKLRDKLEAKLHQKIALVSPQPKGAKGGGEDGDNDGNCDDKKKQVVTTTTLKMNLHCDGCLHKIYKIVSKTKGYIEMSVEREKDHLMVTGIVDAKALADDLKKQMKRNVEIVPPKKEKGGGGDKKDAAGGEKGGGGEKKGGGEGNKNAGEMGFVHHGPCPCNYPYASQLWSDENANACSIL
ncbi:unnamed protein product [Cuscuta epithymum]|uniref:HMA domain-containing protein n=1 Tax=Cuscuta epithymum TaxID=186058 RepID=A0AAV0DE15_9ASTE|nr:unnamed protein product [Cuscuta epithymum]